MPADATAAPPPLREPPQRMDTRRGKILATQIQQQDKETEIHWLGTEPDTFLALFRADHSGEPFANLLILHDNRQHPDWPGLVNSLRTRLAAHGWNTLAISLPDYIEQPALPLREQASSEPGAEPAAVAPTTPDPAAGAATPEDPADKPSVEYPAAEVPDVVDARAREAITFLQQKADLPLAIVAVGLSATIAAKKAQSMLVADISGLVIIDPVEPASLEFNINLDTMDLRIPVLDIAPGFSPRSDPQLRRNSATRSRHPLYQQRVLPGTGPDFAGMVPAVVRAIRGWGERYFKQPQ
ncbi:MAG: DUF3530 family protein [Gammaproteobacteria bacterium]